MILVDCEIKSSELIYSMLMDFDSVCSMYLFLLQELRNKDKQKSYLAIFQIYIIG